MNQLTILDAYITLLKDKQQDLSSNEYLKKITFAIQRITAMIRFSKEYEKIGVTGLAKLPHSCRYCSKADSIRRYHGEKRFSCQSGGIR